MGGYGGNEKMNILNNVPYFQLLSGMIRKAILLRLLEV
jgi:hypothetical protein